MEKFKTLGLGTGTSPVLFQNLVIIQRDEDEGKASVIVAYDKQTGRKCGRRSRPVQISWSTPVLVDAGNRTELVTNGTELAIAYDPGTGKELWRTTGVESNAIHTPLVGKGLVIVTAGYPEKKVIAIRPGDVSPTTARRLGIRQGHRLRPLQHSLWRLCVSVDRQRRGDLPRCRNRRGQVRRRPRRRCPRTSWDRRSRSAD